MESRKVPEIGWITPAKLVRVIDGDTVEVQICRTLHIRPLDCWCDETRTKDLEEKKHGIAAKRFLESVVKQNGRDVVVHIMGDPGEDVTKTFTMSRALGRVWLSDGRELSEVMREAGHATATKEELEKRQRSRK